MPTDPVESLREQRQRLIEQTSSLAAFRPGSLVARYRKCGKPACHCAREGDPGHGPSWSLTRSVRGKTVTKIIPLHHVEETKQQIERYHAFQRLTQELVETNVKICDTLLERDGDDRDGHEAEKGGFTQR